MRQADSIAFGLMADPVFVRLKREEADMRLAQFDSDAPLLTGEYHDQELTRCKLPEPCEECDDKDCSSHPSNFGGVYSLREVEE